MVSRSCGVAFVFTIWIAFDEDAKDYPSNQPRRQSSGASDTISNGKSPSVCAGINRHEGEDERALRERSSEPLGPEFCAVLREE
jgi:hypothetical protein